MEALDADADLVDRFITRCLFIDTPREDEDFFPEAKTKHKLLESLEALAQEMEVFESPPLGSVEREHVWDCSGEYNRIASCGAEALIDHAVQLTDRMEEDDYRQRHGDPDPWLIECFVKMKASDKMIDWEEQERAEADHASLATCELIGYHPVDGSNAIETTTFFNGKRAVLDYSEKLHLTKQRDWLKRQPLPFRILINETRRCNDYPMLSQIAKKVRETTWETYLLQARDEKFGSREIAAIQAIVKGSIEPYNKLNERNGAIRFRFRINQESLERLIDFTLNTIPPLTKTQASVFWTFRNITRNRLGMAPVKLHEVRLQGQKLLTRIFESKSMKQLKWLGAKMVEFSKCRIPGNRCTQAEWATIWSAYRER